MPDISKERRAAYREEATDRPNRLVPVDKADLLALLDAADERDRLREAANAFCDKLYQESGATYELDLEALERLEALLCPHRSDLAAALAAATGPSRELDERMAVEVFGWRMDIGGTGAAPPGFNYFLPNMPPAYTASLEAITGAIKQRWPDIHSIRTYWQGDFATAELRSADLRLHTDCTPYRGDLPFALCLAAVRLAMAEEGPASAPAPRPATRTR